MVPEDDTGPTTQEVAVLTAGGHIAITTEDKTVMVTKWGSQPDLLSVHTHHGPLIAINLHGDRVEVVADGVKMGACRWSELIDFIVASHPM